MSLGAEDADDALLNIERRVVQTSFDSGVAIGRDRGDADGFALGFTHGFALGSELAQYTAFVTAASAALFGELSVKAAAAVELLAERLREFRAATSNEALQAQVDAIRSLYRKAASLCKVGAAVPAAASESAQL